MSVHRLVNSRAADAVSALRGACAELDRSLNSTRESSMLGGVGNQSNDDATSSPGAKRRRTENGDVLTDGETVRELKVKLAQCRTKILALEAQKEMQVPLLHRECIHKDQKILELTKEVEKIGREKLAATEQRTKMEQELTKERAVHQSKQQSHQREIQQLRMRVDDVEKSRESSVKEAEQMVWREKQRRLKEEEVAFQNERLLIEAKTGRDEAISKLHLAEQALRKEKDDLDHTQEENKRLAEEVSQLKKYIQDHEWASNLLENGRELSEKMKIMAEWDVELN
ncbi:mitotic spindle assembly checkpoint protein MAD1-like, partial [Tropilaelaps mercedesae]